MKKRKKEKRIALKMLLCLIYLIAMTVLFVCSYTIYQEKKKLTPWDEVEKTNEYTYMDIYKMSEKFAYNKDSNIGIHFVIVKEATGLWHTYLIAINENNYNKYKGLIDYTYERIQIEPPPMRIYGYPAITTNDMKTLAIKNIGNFLPAENEVQITEENYKKYLTNSYLDTTKTKKESFSLILCISFGLIFVVFALFIMTIFDKGIPNKK